MARCFCTATRAQAPTRALGPFPSYSPQRTAMHSGCVATVVQYRTALLALDEFMVEMVEDGVRAGELLGRLYLRADAGDPALARSFSRCGQLPRGGGRYRACCAAYQHSDASASPVAARASLWSASWLVLLGQLTPWALYGELPHGRESEFFLRRTAAAGERAVPALAEAGAAAPDAYDTTRPRHSHGHTRSLLANADGTAAAPCPLRAVAPACRPTVEPAWNLVPLFLTPERVEELIFCGQAMPILRRSPAGTSRGRRCGHRRWRLV